MRKLAMLLAAVLTIELCCPATAYAQPATYAVEDVVEELQNVENDTTDASADVSMEVTEKGDTFSELGGVLTEETNNEFVESVNADLEEVESSALKTTEGEKVEESFVETMEAEVVKEENRSTMKLTFYDNGLLELTGTYIGGYWKFGLPEEEIESITEIYCNLVIGTESNNLSQLFYEFYNVKKITFGENFVNSTGNITGMSSMFDGCTSLETLDVSGWNTANVTDMSSMFSDCESLKTLDVSRWNTENVTNMRQMFSCCNALENLDVSNWNTAKVTSMNNMFSGCQVLTALDVSNWNTSNVEDIAHMFSNCKALTFLDLSKWDMGSATSTYAVINENDSLHLLKTPTNIIADFSMYGRSFYKLNNGVIDKTTTYFTIPAGTTESWTLIRPENHVWTEYTEGEDGKPVRNCSVCGEIQVQTGVRLLLQDAYYYTKNGYPLVAAFVLPKDTIPGENTLTLQSLTLKVDEGEEKEITVQKYSSNWYYQNGDRAGQTYAFNAGYDKNISVGEHTLTYKAVFNNGSELETVTVSKKAMFVNDLGSKEIVVPLRSNQNTQYVPASKGSKIKVIPADANFTSGTEKISSLKIRNHETKEEIPFKVLYKTQNKYNGKVCDSRYGSFVDPELGITVWASGMFPEEYTNIYAYYSIQLTQDIPEGIYDVEYTTTKGIKYIFEEYYEATNKTVIFTVKDTKGAKASTDEGYFDSVSTYSENLGDYVSVYVYGINLDKNNVPVFYNNEKTTAISEYNPESTDCAMEVWEYGIDFTLRKNDPTAEEWLNDGNVPVMVVGADIYADGAFSNKPAPGSEDGFIVSDYDVDKVYRTEYNADDKYFRVYLSTTYANVGDVFEVSNNSYSWNNIGEATVQSTGTENYIEFLSDTEVYEIGSGYSGFYVRKQGETESVWVSVYWDPKPKTAKNITVPANCSWEVHAAKDVGKVIYSGTTTTKKNVLTASQVNALAGKGMFRVCIYDEKGEVIKGGRYLTYFYKEPVYKIEYVLNDGENNPESPAEYSSSEAVTLEAPSRYGYAFAGWYSDAGLTKKVTKIAKGSKGNRTFYAKWDVSKYSIEYNANGGTGKMKATACEFGKEATIAGNTFTRKGYVFTGWNTDKDGKGIAYQVNDKVINLSPVNGEKIQLYAIWEPISYTVVLDKNATDATFGAVNDEEDAKAVYRYEEVLSVSGNEFVRNGYNISYWSNKENGKGTKFVKGRDYKNLTETNGETVTIYAIWAKNTYNVIYNLDGGKVKGSNPKKYYVDSATITLKEPTKTGYVFEGWYETDEEGKLVGDPVKEIAKGSYKNLSLTAKWTPATYIVELNPNTEQYVSGENSVAKTVEYQYSSEVTPADWSAKYDTVEEWKSKGYGILYWSTKPNGSGKKYYDEKTYSALATTGTVKLYAKWGMKNYTITYVNAEGSRNSNPVKYTFDANKKITLKEPTKKGYTFEGWYTNSEFTEESKVTEISCNQCNDITLYAKMTPITYTVKLAPNGSDAVVKEGLVTSFDVNFGEEFTLVEDAFTRPHYKIAYWSTKANGSGKKIQNGAVGDLTTTDKSEVTLYPKWELVTYTISYENMDYEKVINKSPVSYKYNAKKVVKLKNPTRPGYVFGGWFNEDTTVENFNPETSMRHTEIAKATGGDIRLYAYWKPISYKIQLVANAKDAELGINEDVISISYGDGIELEANSYTRKGYVLTGFSTKKNGKGSLYTFDEPQYIYATKANSTVKLYAIWEKVKTQKVMDVILTTTSEKTVVSFNPNDGCTTYEISYSPYMSMKDAKFQYASELDAVNGMPLVEVENGTRYFVRVREIRNDSLGNLIRGEWSSLRSIVVETEKNITE